MIIWLASYPKSGNTWLRLFISSILFSSDGNANFEDIKKIDQYPRRKFFDGLISNFEDMHEIKKNWITSQDLINLDNKIKILKTHHMHCEVDNYSFTNNDNTLGVIYVVRDPRNVITSIMHHFHKSSYKEAKESIFEEKKLIGSKKDNDKMLTITGSWKTNYLSWKKIKKNFLLIKYENLISNPKNEFNKIVQYLQNLMNIEIDKKKIEKAINSTSFENLSELETKHGFEESVVDKKTGKNKKFFNLGPKNDWRKLLDNETINEIEEKFNSEMKELGYLN